MKKIFFYSVLAVSITLGACNQKAAAPKGGDKMTSDPKGVNIKLSQLATNKDLNCGMGLEEGVIADTTTYQGKIYGFCSPECKADFLKDPAAKLSQK
jgi:YHS domain-containing protein